MRKYVLIASCLLGAPANAAESDRLREIMGEDVYRRSGIEMLSEQQIEVLERWVLGQMGRSLSAEEAASPPLDQRRAATGPAGPGASTPESSNRPRPAGDDDQPAEVIRSRIDGHFDGWRRNGTLFRLQNGQIWEQRQPGTFVTNLESPEVVIRENRFGHTMEIPAIGRKVHVRRVR